MRGTVRVLMAMLLAALGWLTVPPAMAHAAPQNPATTYIYDSPKYDAPGPSSASERGPPSMRHAATTYDAVDLWSHGNLARQDGLDAPSITTYNYSAPLVQVARATTTTGTQIQSPDGDLSSIVRSVGAANTATKLNRAGRAYPEVIDPRTGSAIHFPGEGLAKVPVSQRVPWGSQERGSFIKQWYDRGYSTPEGGWSGYDIHDIRPREYGGTNDFDNLVPIPRDVHQQQFNSWWRDY